MCDWLFSTAFVDNLIDTFLEEIIIPDLLLEVITHKTTLEVCFIDGRSWMDGVSSFKFLTQFL